MTRSLRPAGLTCCTHLEIREAGAWSFWDAYLSRRRGHANMKVQVFLPLTIVLSAILVVLIKVRQEEKENEGKRGSFVDIKLRVSEDVLREYANEKQQLNQDIDTAKDEYQNTEKGRKGSQEAADKVMHEAQKCAEEQVRADGGRWDPAAEECSWAGKFWLKLKERIWP